MNSCCVVIARVMLVAPAGCQDVKTSMLREDMIGTSHITASLTVVLLAPLIRTLSRTVSPLNSASFSIVLGLSATTELSSFTASSTTSLFGLFFLSKMAVEKSFFLSSTFTFLQAISSQAGMQVGLSSSTCAKRAKEPRHTHPRKASFAACMRLVPSIRLSSAPTGRQLHRCLVMPCAG